MYATQELRNEHEGIRVALAVLERMADSTERGVAPDLNDADRILEFLQTFADKCHHGKEEDLLFPAMERAGVPREHGPIGVMLTDHEHGREHIKAMVQALAGLRSGDSDAPAAFAAAARGYVQVLSNHINKENNVLFVMAEQNLPPEEHARLAEGFEKIEQERIGPGVHESYHALLEELSAKYLD
mgnify:CR=1 FL=1